MISSKQKLDSIFQNGNIKLCVGLDPDINNFPSFLKNTRNPILEFNKAIIEATQEFVSAYKLNFAFFEQYGLEGIEALKATFDLIPKDKFTIADAKRGDIGNTSKAYAKACFEYFGADAATVNPYMGRDSVVPFLEIGEKFIFVLALTSNQGSNDFQKLISNDKPIYNHIIEKTREWGGVDQLGYVIGATHPSQLEEIRNDVMDRVILIPGVGAQGGSVPEVIKANQGGPAFINVSRAVIYASAGHNFDMKAREMAESYATMFEILTK